MQKVEVPDTVAEDEFLGRIILHSFHYSEKKEKLRPEAFMPSPSEGDEISIIRYGYTNIDFCKMRGLVIAERRNKPTNPCKFIGVAFLSCKEVEEAPINVDGDGNIDEDFQANPIATPLCEKEELREDRPIYANDEGIPCHGDIKYNVNIFEHTPIKQKFKQRVIKPLVTQAQIRFFKDVDTLSQEWVGEDILLESAV